jgi:octaprenyl-diphosphate synthase
MELEKIYSPIKEELGRIESELRSQLLSSKNKFILQVNRYLLDGAGKRLRPSLVLLCAKVNNHWDEKAILVAAALELIHAASLVHDDVLDEASLRRKKATVNTRWGNESAILTGDYLYFKAFSILSRLEVPRISSIVSFAAEMMCEGEIIQTCKTYQLNLSEEDYLEIIEKKTASLMAASCEAGAVLSGSHPLIQKALANYGLNFGMAFQIIDDCLDLVSPSDKTGKSTYKDFAQGKMSLPLIYLVRKLTKEDKQKLNGFFRKDREEIINLLREYETIEQSWQTTKEYLSRAKDQLKVLQDSKAKEALSLLSDYLLESLNPDLENYKIVPVVNCSQSSLNCKASAQF